MHCEAAEAAQPLMTTSPSGRDRLPTEPGQMERFSIQSHDASYEYIPVEALTNQAVRPFGRAAQAAWLLDRVILAIRIPEIDPTRLDKLAEVGVCLRIFLDSTMQQCDTSEEQFCEAIAITIR